MLNDLFGLKGKRALVMGSSKGIGYALARGLGKAGAEVILNGRNAGALEAASAQLASEGIDAEANVFDVTESASVRDAVAAIERDMGPIDILVNNASMQFRTPLEDFPDDRWRELMRTNVDSFVNGHILYVDGGIMACL